MHFLCCHIGYVDIELQLGDQATVDFLVERSSHVAGGDCLPIGEPGREMASAIAATRSTCSLETASSIPFEAMRCRPRTTTVVSTKELALDGRTPCH
jgi:hypothetical protein